jgi:hypothetical protein
VLQPFLPLFYPAASVAAMGDLDCDFSDIDLIVNSRRTLADWENTNGDAISVQWEWQQFDAVARAQGFTATGLFCSRFFLSIWSKRPLNHSLSIFEQKEIKK